MRGIGARGECCGDNNVHFGRINMLYHEAMLWAVIRALRGALRPRARRYRRPNPKSQLGELYSPEDLVKHIRG